MFVPASTIFSLNLFNRVEDDERRLAKECKERRERGKKRMMETMIRTIKRIGSKKERKDRFERKDSFKCLFEGEEE